MRSINKQPKQRCIILSAEKATLTSHENEVRTTNLQNKLLYLKLLFKPVQGHYKGKDEAAFLINAKTQESEKLIHSLIAEFDQECALLIDEFRDAHYIYLSGSTIKQGKFVAITKEKALSSVSYTYDRTGGGYYGIE